MVSLQISLINIKKSLSSIANKRKHKYKNIVITIKTAVRYFRIENILLLSFDQIYS